MLHLLAECGLSDAFDSAIETPDDLAGHAPAGEKRSGE
jgi:hypothetical protein